MALFRRNKTDDTAALPAEVTDYYQAENRERTWMAWLLALVTLAVTAVIIIVLFFGGRWIYRKVRHSSNTTTAVVTQKPADTSKANNPTPSPATNTAPSSANGNVNAPTNPGTTPTTPAPTATAPTASTSSPAPSPTPAPLANTGPGNMLGVFVAVSIAAYILHRRLQRQ